MWETTCNAYILLFWKRGDELSEQFINVWVPQFSHLYNGTSNAIQLCMYIVRTKLSFKNSCVLINKKRNTEAEKSCVVSARTHLHALSWVHGCSSKPKKGIGSPESGVTSIYEPLNVNAGSQTSPLKECQVHLAAEQSLQLQNDYKWGNTQWTTAFHLQAPSTHYCIKPCQAKWAAFPPEMGTSALLSLHQPCSLFD